MPIGQLGMMLAGAGLGQILAPINDRRQLRQQEQLQNLQIAGSKELTDYNTQKQMEMWENTSYPAQMAMLKKAGLNPALMYGMGGGGGQTANISQGSVGGADAPKGGGEIMGMQLIGQQAALIAAQTRNIEADTQNKLSENPNIPKQGKKLDTEITSLTQGIQESKARQALIDVETSIKSIEETVKGATQNHEISRIIKATEIMANDEKISTATINDKIKQIGAEATGALVSNALGEQKTAESIATVKKMAADIIQRSIQLDQEQQKIEIQKWVETIKANFPSIGNVLGRSLNDLIEGIIGASKSGSRTTHYEPPKHNK